MKTNLYSKLKTDLIEYKQRSSSILHGKQEEFFLNLGGYAAQWSELFGVMEFYHPEYKKKYSILRWRPQTSLYRSERPWLELTGSVISHESPQPEALKVSTTLRVVSAGQLGSPNLKFRDTGRKPYLNLDYNTITIQNTLNVLNRGTTRMEEAGLSWKYSTRLWSSAGDLPTSNTCDYLNNRKVVNDRETLSVVLFRNKQNGGYNWTLFNRNYSQLTMKVRKLARIASINPGRYGIFKKASRRAMRPFITWLTVLFTLILEKQTSIESSRSGDGTIKKFHDVYTIKHTVLLNISNLNNIFLQGLTQITKLLKPMNHNDILVNVFSNWRGLNLHKKKARYLKKFKRKSLYHADRYKRRVLLP